MEKEVLKSDWQVLVGFWDEATASNYLQGQGVPLKPHELESLKAEIRRARAYVQALPSRKGEPPEIRPMEGTIEARLKSQLEPESTFQEHLIGMRDPNFAWVELSKLIVFQPQINTKYVESFSPPPESEPAKVVEFCLPPTSKAQSKQVVQGFNPVSNTFTIVTDNLDFRILGNVQGEDPQSGRKFVGFAYGGGLPQMSVVEYKGQYILKNGYHRAYALFRAGHKFLPTLLVHTDSYANTGAGAPGFFPVDTVLSDRPPRLADFSTPAAVAIPRRLLRVMVTVHAEVQVFPV